MGRMSDGTRWIKRVKSLYGNDVIQYLHEVDVDLEETENFFKAPYERVMYTCSRLAKSFSDTVANMPKKEKNKKLTLSEYSQIFDNIKMDDVIIDTERPEEPVIEVIDNPLAKYINVIINFDEYYVKSRPATEGIFFGWKNCLHLWNLEKIFERIMLSPLGHENISNGAWCKEKLFPILKAFEDRHRKLNYRAILESILKKEKDEKSPRVSVDKFCEYFNVIVTEVIPVDLLGNTKNMKILKKGLKEYFRAPWNQEMCLKRFLFAMDISCITWLNDKKQDEKSQWFMLAKLLKWLFDAYFFVVFKAVFVVKKDLYSEKKLFLSSFRMKKMSKCYMQLMTKKGCLVEMKNVPDFSQYIELPPGQLTLYPKTNGLRAILKFRYKKTHLDDLTVIKILLQQLFMQKHGKPMQNHLYHTWLEHAKMRKKDPNYKVYVVASDVCNAFGSVVQERLFDIVNDMLNKIPDENLPLDRMAVLEPNKGWGKNPVVHKRWFSCFKVYPPMKSGSIIAPSLIRTQLISKEYVRSFLEAIIFTQTVRFNGVEYILKKGLAQGTPLSPILFDMYYTHAMKDIFQRFMKSGDLLRFVDDFLYITPDERSARTFINVLRKGNRPYNCCFNMKKTQTNVASKSLKPTSQINFIGFTLHTEYLAVTPFYDHIEMRYWKSMQNINYRNKINTFVFKLRRIVTSKLHPLLLDNRINDRKVLVRTAKLVSRKMAICCKFLLLRIFDQLGNDAFAIWCEIRRTIDKVIKRFDRPFDSETLRKKVLRRVSLTMWKSFYRIFAKNRHTRLHICSRIREIIMYKAPIHC